MMSYFYPAADIPTGFCCCIRSRFRRDVQVPVTQRSFGLFAGELKGRSLFQMTPNQIGRLPSDLRQATEGHTTVANNMMGSKRVKQRFKYRPGLDGAAKQRAAKKESCEREAVATQVQGSMHGRALLVKRQKGLEGQHQPHVTISRVYIVKRQELLWSGSICRSIAAVHRVFEIHASIWASLLPRISLWATNQMG